MLPWRPEKGVKRAGGGGEEGEGRGVHVGGNDVRLVMERRRRLGEDMCREGRADWGKRIWERGGRENRGGGGRVEG